MTQTKRTILVGLMICALLAGATAALLACGGPAADSPGPACNCAGPDGNGDSGEGASICPGKPIASVNEFTGDLILRDMPVFSNDPSAGIPFTMTYSVQSTRSSSLGKGWTFSYNMYITESGNTATFIDGNGRETTFTIYDDELMPSGGRACGGAVLSGDFHYRIRRPSPLDPAMNFDWSGRLASLEDHDGQVWSLEVISKVLPA
jgi:hypothetical protein